MLMNIFHKENDIIADWLVNNCGFDCIDYFDNVFCKKIITKDGHLYVYYIHLNREISTLDYYINMQLTDINIQSKENEKDFTYKLKVDVDSMFQQELINFLIDFKKKYVDDIEYLKKIALINNAKERIKYDFI